MKILQVRHLTKRFGELTAVKDLSFDVEKGEVFGIGGPNGSGKTTLFNLLTGFYQGSGDIILGNVTISGLRPHQICHKGVARTFQITQLFSTLSVLENIKVGTHFGAQRVQNEEENTKKVINLLGLEGKENVAAANLNLFDKKLTMLGAALATKPVLLLLDEPIGGLSPTEIRQSIALFQRINKELGLTMIIIEHLMKVLTGLCHRLMIIHNGKKIYIGPPQEVSEDKRVREVYLGG